MELKEEFVPKKLSKVGPTFVELLIIAVKDLYYLAVVTSKLAVLAEDEFHKCGAALNGVDCFCEGCGKQWRSEFCFVPRGADVARRNLVLYD